MQVTITTIVFGLPQGQRTSHVQVALLVSTLTLHDLIACKIEQEVSEILAHQRPGLSGEYFTPETLILATDALQPATVADEIQRAQQAFAARDFMIAIDDRQVWDPATVVDLTP